MTGRQDLARAFDAARKAGRPAVIPYFVAGYPSFSKCADLLWQARDAGCAAVELGIPFSDPVADGPTLQAVLHHALEKGVTVRKSLDFVRKLRKDGFDTPILGMTYANLLFARGYDRAAKEWAAAGLSGAIIPDVPLDEGRVMRKALRAAGLGTVSFASPGTSAERLARVLATGDSFVYLVAVYGTTGARKGVAPETKTLLASARAARRGHRPPLCVGFGVSQPAHVRALASLGADGVIVGSALVPLIQKGGHVQTYLRSLTQAAPPRPGGRQRF